MKPRSFLKHFMPGHVVVKVVPFSRPEFCHFTYLSFFHFLKLYFCFCLHIVVICDLTNPPHSYFCDFIPFMNKLTHAHPRSGKTLLKIPTDSWMGCLHCFRSEIGGGCHSGFIYDWVEVVEGNFWVKKWG